MRKIYLLILICLLTACHQRSYFPSKHEMDPQHIAIHRFDCSLLNVQASTVHEDVSILYEEYPDFMPFFVEDILGIPTYDTAYLCEALPAFLSDTVYGFAEANKREKELFADIFSLQKELDDAFTRIHYLYPDWTLPDIYLFVSGFNSSIRFLEEDIAVGTDMYLGSDYELYNRVVYDYQRITMRPECISADVVSAYLFRQIPYTSRQVRLLDQMLYRGKVLYLLRQLFPDLPEYEVMGYSREQWDWCVENERDIWHLIMDKRDLFKTETIVLTSYLNEGPFTSEVSQEAPGRLGTWVGWRIVASYMEHHPEVTLQQLMAEADAQLILEQSYYKP